MKRIPLISALLIPLFSSPIKTEASPGDSYQKVYKECMQMGYFKEEDGALNAAYKKLIAALPPDKAAKLKADQKQWIKDCEWQVKNDGKPHKNLSNMTITRKEELEEMVAKLKK